MKSKNKMLLVTGIIWIVIDLLVWFMYRVNFNFLVMKYGVKQAYFFLFVHFIIFNMPAFIMIIIALVKWRYKNEQSHNF